MYEPLCQAARELGLAQFLPGQLEAMIAVMEQQKTLVVRPTGSGKTACVLVPIVAMAHCMPGCVYLIFTPLQAIQSQQLDSLSAIRCVSVISLGADPEAGQSLRRLLAKRPVPGATIVLLNPETYAEVKTALVAVAARVKIIVFDEAWAYKSWADTFRSSIDSIVGIARNFPSAHLVGLSALFSFDARHEFVDFIAAGPLSAEWHVCETSATRIKLTLHL